MTSKALFPTTIFLLSICLQGISQGNNAQFGKSIYFDIETTYKPTGISQSDWFDAPDTAVYTIIDYLDGQQIINHVDRKAKTPILMGLKLNPLLQNFYGEPIHSFSHFYSAYLINDNSEAELIALGINADNINDFQYRVVENDSLERIPWSAIPALNQQYGAKKAYGFIGKFKAPGKQLFIEIKNKKDYSIRDGVVLDWRTNHKPSIAQMVVVTPGKFFNIINKNNNEFATDYDTYTGMPRNMKFPLNAISRFDIQLNKTSNASYRFFLIKRINQKTDTIVLESKTGILSYQLESALFTAPGKYEFIIQPAGDLGDWPESQRVRFPFEVIPPPGLDKKVSLRTILPYGLATLLGVALLFLLYRRNSQIKLIISAREKESIGFQLKGIRSQLNPHFMYNALGSIQGLMNKNDIVSANRYLSKFAGLTRKVLQSTDKEFISLADEIQVIDDYLYMEQLRFGFIYTIEPDERINLDNTEIPSMLLQPLAENAVKHSAALLKHEGVINIRIKKQNNDIVISVNDNGKGFDISSKYAGFGLKLSNERIALLNKIYNEPIFSLQVHSNVNGTKAIITLQNWL